MPYRIVLPVPQDPESPRFMLIAHKQTVLDHLYDIQVEVSRLEALLEWDELTIDDIHRIAALGKATSADLVLLNRYIGKERRHARSHA